MSHSSSWSAPPIQALQAVFERQQNALDNAAAACACKAWRAAVNSSTAQALHLHANSISNLQEWGSCLKAYSSICCLKLTASYHLSHVADPELASVQHSMFNNIPEACDTLCVGAPFVGAVHFYTDRQVQLQQLKMHCCGPDGAERTLKLPSSFPDLRHLTDLKALQLHVCGISKNWHSGGQPATAGASLTGSNLRPKDLLSCLQTCPVSLQSFSMRQSKQLRRHRLAFRWTAAVEDVLHTHLTSLRHLEVEGCQVTLSCDAMRSLTPLTGLSFSQSSITLERETHIKLTILTNLQSLDISESRWCTKDGASMRMSHFVAWSNLKMLNICGCSLFVKSTQFVVSSVHEVHSDEILHALSTGNFWVHLHGGALRLKQALLDVTSTSARCVVSLLLSCEVDLYRSSDIACVTDQVLTHCTFLKVFQLRHQPTAYTTLHQGQGSVLLKEDQGCHLERILLVGFKCSSIDLRSSVSLLQVTITDIDTLSEPCLLAFPKSLQRLCYCGANMCCLDMAAGLHLCEDLTEIKFFVMVGGVRQQHPFTMCMPRLPMSLRSLEIDFAGTLDRHENAKAFMSICEWQTLMDCQQLKRVRLPVWCPAPETLLLQLSRSCAIMDAESDQDDVFLPSHFV